MDKTVTINILFQFIVTTKLYVLKQLLYYSKVKYNIEITIIYLLFRDLLDEAKDYHLMPERRLLLQSFRTRPRCVSYIRGHIYAVGGLTKSGFYLFKPFG